MRASPDNIVGQRACVTSSCNSMGPRHIPAHTESVISQMFTESYESQLTPLGVNANANKLSVMKRKKQDYRSVIDGHRESRLLKCPTCNAITPPRSQNKSYPFCCKRCKMVDLGHWFGESYVLSRPVNPEVDREAFESLVLAAPGEENV